MKPLFSRLLIGVLVATIPMVSMQACDICGCAASSNPMGVLALSQQHLLGTRWNMQSYRSRPHGSGIGAQERFISADLWSRWQVTPRLQITGIIPVHFNSRLLDDGTSQQANGLGDFTLMGSFHLISPEKQAKRRWRHYLLANIGTQLPTGRTTDPSKAIEAVAVHQNLQPGTGNTRLLASAIYMTRYQNWGLLLEQSHQRSVWQKADFRPGNRNRSAARAIYFAQTPKMLIAPYMGAQYESLEHDYDATGRLSESGGNALLGMVGLDCFWGRFNFNADFQAPIQQHLAKGYVTARPRYQLSVAFNLSATKKADKVIAAPMPFKNIVPDTHSNQHINN